MPADALSPGPNGTYPWFPRDASGAPAWSDTHSPTDVVHPTLGGTPILRGPRHRTVPRLRYWQGVIDAIHTQPPSYEGLEIPTVPVAELRAELGLPPTA